MKPPKSESDTNAEWRTWLRQEVTVTYPRWAFLAVGAVVVILGLIALD